MSTIPMPVSCMVFQWRVQPHLQCNMVPESQDDQNNQKCCPCDIYTSVSQENTSVSQENSSSDQETEMQVLEQQLSSSPAQFAPHMYMPYLEGPKMDWRVNDGLYHRLLKWKLKCENILDCELAMLSESKKCKKVVAWSGDFGMDQYVSWYLPADELNLDTIWSKYEDFCNPQLNEV